MCRHVLLLLVLSTQVACFSTMQAIGGQKGKEADRSGGYRSTGIGGGMWLITEDQGADPNKQRWALGLDTKWGFGLSEQFSIYLALDLAFHDWDTIGDIYHWLFQKDEYTLLRLTIGFPLIFLAPLAGSYSLTGPGFSWRSSQKGSAVVLDAGLGLSGFLRPSDEKYLFGAGLWGGAGYEFTEQVGLGFRVMWSPPYLQSFFSSTDSHVVALLLNLYLTSR